MATDVRVSLTIEGADTSGKKTSTKIPYINPTISNETMKDFAEKCAALSADTYIGTTKTTEEDITNGGEDSDLEDVGYALTAGDTDVEVPSIIKMADWSELSVDAPWSSPLMSKYGTQTHSGAQTVTFSGLKPVNSEVKFTDGYVRIIFKGDGHVFASGNNLFQLQVHVAPTDTAKGATLYLYLQGVAEDTEAI